MHYEQMAPNAQGEPEAMGFELKVPKGDGDMEVIAVFPTQEAAEEHVAFLKALASGHEIAERTEASE